MRVVAVRLVSSTMESLQIMILKNLSHPEKLMNKKFLIFSILHHLFSPLIWIAYRGSRSIAILMFRVWCFYAAAVGIIMVLIVLFSYPVQAQGLTCCEERIQAPSGAYISSGVSCPSWRTPRSRVIHPKVGTLHPSQSRNKSISINPVGVFTNTIYFPIVVAQETSIPGTKERSMLWIILGVALVAGVGIGIGLSWGSEKDKLVNLQQQNTQTLSDLNEERSTLQSALSLKETEVADLQTALSAKEDLISVQAEQIEDFKDQVAQLQQQVEAAKKENLLKLLSTDQDQLSAMYNAFVESRSKFEDLLTVVLERLELSEEVLEGLDQLLKAQRGMMVEIQGNGQGALQLVVPIPEDPYEFLGIETVVGHDAKKVKKRRDQLLQQFHPDKVNVLNIEWVTKLYTKMTEEINLVFDRARNN